MYEQTTFRWAAMPHAGTGPPEQGEVIHYWRKDQGAGKLTRWYSRCGLTVTEKPMNADGPVIVYPRRCKKCQRSLDLWGLDAGDGRAPLQIDGPGSGGG
ncbi:MAG: hypothetical protein ABSB61_06510 [Anaerolineales bacterium]|jgi:hypothetical protein